MNALFPGVILCLLSICAAWPGPRQQPKSGSQAPQLVRLEQRLDTLVKQLRMGPEVRAAAEQELARLRDARFPDCYAVYKQTEGRVLRAFLGRQLLLPEIEAATAILLAAAPHGEHAQGGVIDHHDLWLRFDDHEVLFADDRTKRDYLLDDRFLLARGRNVDTWLCELLRRDIERHQAKQIWVMKHRLLMHEDGRSGLALHEFVRLPASARQAVRELRK